jgi:hypothetical protein
MDQRPDPIDVRGRASFAIPLTLKLLAATWVPGFGQAHAGLIKNCGNRFGALIDRITLPHLAPDKTEIEDWLETADPLRQWRATRISQELEITGRRRAPLSPSKRQELEAEFERTTRELREGTSKTEHELLLRHVRAASGLLESNGVAHRVRTRSRNEGDLLATEALEIVIEHGDDSSLNRLARGLDRLVSRGELVYDPETAIRRGFEAGFRKGSSKFLSSRKPRLYAPSSSITNGISGSLALRHELQHAYYEHLRSSGKPLRWMHGNYINSSTSPFRPSIFDVDRTYREYMSFEEVATYRQDLLVRLRRLIRGGASEGDIEEIRLRTPQLAELSAKLKSLAELMLAAIHAPPSTTIDLRGSPLEVRLTEDATGTTKIFRFEFSRSSNALQFSTEVVLNFISPEKSRTALLERLREMADESRRIQEFASVIQERVQRGILDPSSDRKELVELGRLLDQLKSASTAPRAAGRSDPP